MEKKKANRRIREHMWSQSTEDNGRSIAQQAQEEKRSDCGTNHTSASCHLKHLLRKRRVSKARNGHCRSFQTRKHATNIKTTWRKRCSRKREANHTRRGATRGYYLCERKEKTKDDGRIHSIRKAQNNTER